VTRPAGRYLDALARAARWAGPDPGLPARPRPRSRFEADNGDNGPSWPLDGEDEEPAAVPAGVLLPVVEPGTGAAVGPGPEWVPARPAPPPAVVTAPATGRPSDAPLVRVETPDGVRLPVADPSPPARPVGDAVPPAPGPAAPPRAPDPGPAVLAASGEPPALVPARPVPGSDDADRAEGVRPGEPGDDRRRPDPGLRSDDPAEETPPRPRATARPAQAFVVGDPPVRPAEAAESAVPPPVVIEIGRIEVRIAPDGPSGRSPATAASFRSAPAPPGPSLADYLAGRTGTAGRRP